MGTLNRIKGVVAMTASICIGIGIKPQKSPTATPLVTIRLFTAKYALGKLYFSKNASILLLPEGFFLKTFRIIYIYSSN